MVWHVDELVGDLFLWYYIWFSWVQGRGGGQGLTFTADIRYQEVSLTEPFIPGILSSRFGCSLTRYIEGTRPTYKTSPIECTMTILTDIDNWLCIGWTWQIWCQVQPMDLASIDPWSMDANHLDWQMRHSNLTGRFGWWMSICLAIVKFTQPQDLSRKNVIHCSHDAHTETHLSHLFFFVVNN